MPEVPLSPSKQVQFLAKWVRPERFADFQASYERVWRGKPQTNWTVLVATSGEKIIAKACEAAAEQKFLVQLVRELAERERAAGRKESEIVEMVGIVRGEQPDADEASGEMHAIINHLSGFMTDTALFAAADAARACAVVSHSGKQQGTAFLVRDNMVLTAAHVALGRQADNANDPWADNLADDLEFSFNALPNRPPTERIKVRPAARNALRTFSKPYGTLDNLRLDFQAGTDPTFDYALIQLAEPVFHVAPIEVDPPSAVEKDNKCWAMGFPGGTALKLDYDDVVDIAVGGGRWLHLANADKGMSGGCCINHLGRLAGLHEGAVKIDLGEGTKKYNRGIGIAEIRAHQLKNGSDPLVVRTATPGVGFDDPQLVAELCRVGGSLASDALGPIWEASVRAVFPDSEPSDPSTLPGFHPWFEREALSNWIDSDNSRKRLCLISGERGAGASFCKHMIRAKLTGRGLPFFDVSPTQLVAFNPSEAIGVAVENPANRTAAAEFRYVDAKELIKHMRPIDAVTPRLSTIAIDVGPVGGPDRLIGKSWQEFIVQLLAEEWIRVVLIGLTRDEQIVLGDALRASAATETLIPASINLDPIGPLDFEDFAIRLRNARGFATEVAIKELRERIASVVGGVPGLTLEMQKMQTCKYALAAILLEREFRKPA